MSKEKKTLSPDKPKVDESDYSERVEKFTKELQPLLGKYELGIKPHVTLLPDPNGAYHIVPQLQIISERKAPGQEEKKVEKNSPTDLIKD